MFKLLSWNIRQGGGSRITKITKSLQSFNADVIVLSEFRNNEGGHKIRHNLLRLGYRFQNVTNAKSNDNAVATFSKIPCNLNVFLSADEKYTHNVNCSVFEAFNIYGVYLPHKKKHKLFDFLLEEIKQDKPCIIVGDYNTGINHVDQKGKSFWYTDKMEALSEHGCVDAFRFLHGKVSEYSWYSHQGNGYRYDHTYVSKALIPIVKSCYYLHEWRENGLSDHSPMVLELG
ncbi:MAG: hypothetical protein HKO66_08725 [Saprospiraceae bacterium]|nr:endonuclease/exonuclease/phosphatase family protein [Bacteroidia bacterium]NNE14071.1 hypothetical protein [Saprospiraceae bacterium]NNL92301.1 hypothetical protein [Saprospiraceae bacterium]